PIDWTEFLSSAPTTALARSAPGIPTHFPISTWSIHRALVSPTASPGRYLRSPSLLVCGRRPGDPSAAVRLGLLWTGRSAGLVLGSSSVSARHSRGCWPTGAVRLPSEDRVPTGSQK